MSGKGNCYDNAPAESFFALLKRELIYRLENRDIHLVRRKVFEYIEIFYNTKRIHSSINYLTPVEFETLNKAA